MQKNKIKTLKDSDEQSRREFRFYRVRLAFLSSSASKVLGFLVQFLAVPLAVKALGTERFGIYTMLVSALVWIDLGRLGIGPGLTREMAVAWNRGDSQSERILFSNAFILLMAVALLVAVIFVLLFNFGGISFRQLVGDSAYSYRSEIEAGALIVIIFLLAQIIFSAGEAARSAYQEDYINNAMSSFGNLAAIGLVVWVGYYWPTIQGFTIAIFGSIALSKGANLLLLLSGSRRYLMPRWHHFRRNTAGLLLKVSLAFWVVQLATLMMHNFSLVQLGTIVGPDELAPFAVLFRLLQLLSTGVLMITMPLWPAITDALVRNDFDWIRYSYGRLIKIVLTYSIGVAITLGLLGEYLIHLWVGDNIYFDPNLAKSLSAYFVIWMWNHSNIAVLFGLGKLWEVAITMLAEGALVLMIGHALVPLFGNLGMAFSLCIAGLITSSWIFPLIIRRELRDMSLG